MHRHGYLLKLVHSLCNYEKKRPLTVTLCIILYFKHYQYAEIFASTQQISMASNFILQKLSLILAFCLVLLRILFNFPRNASFENRKRRFCLVFFNREKTYSGNKAAEQNNFSLIQQCWWLICYAYKVLFTCNTFEKNW